MINMSPHNNIYDKLPIILCSFSPAARDYKHVEIDAAISEKVAATSSSHSIAAPSIVIVRAKFNL